MPAPDEPSEEKLKKTAPELLAALKRLLPLLPPRRAQMEALGDAADAAYQLLKRLGIKLPERTRKGPPGSPTNR